MYIFMYSGKGKGKFAVEEAMKAQKGGRVIAVLFL